MADLCVIGGMRLKLKRITKHISQWDLSQQTGIPNYRISLIENGRVEPKPEELTLLAEALGTTVEAIEDDNIDAGRNKS